MYTASLVLHEFLFLLILFFISLILFYQLSQTGAAFLVNQMIRGSYKRLYKVDRLQELSSFFTLSFVFNYLYLVGGKKVVNFPSFDNL